MKKNYNNIILDKMETGKSYTFSDFIKKNIKASIYGNTITKYFRAWEDLKIQGRLTETKTGWRKNI